MREDICSIPINDVFLPREGCPICRMRDLLEDRIATYITGAAMMEPDVREETNRLGFCGTHFDHILARGSRLSVALILESLTAQVKAEIFPGEKTPAKKIATAVKSRMDHCFICENVEKNMCHLIGSMLVLWEKAAEFRELYARQPYLCLPHYGMVIDAAQKLPKKSFSAFAAASHRLSQSYLETLCGDVTHFCRMFDYRNKDQDWGNSKDSAVRAVHYLTSRFPAARQKADEKNR